MSLLEWESSTDPIFVAFCSLSPPLLAHERYCNVDDIVTHLATAINLCTLICDLVCKHKCQQLKTLFMTMTMPHLTSPPAFLPSSNIILVKVLYIWRFSTYVPLPSRSSAPITLFLSHGLYETIPSFPLWPPYSLWLWHSSWWLGGAFLQLPPFPPKPKHHNCNRDAIHLLFSEIGLHAGILCSQSDVTSEPLGLAHCNPTSDLPTYWLTFPYLHQSSLLPFAKVAIDIQIMGLPSTPSDGHSIHTVSVTHLHQVTEQENSKVWMLIHPTLS